MNQSLYGSLLLNFWVGSIPDSGIPVSGSRDHDGRHDGSDIEGGPL